VKGSNLGEKAYIAVAEGSERSK